ncbi:hypothetical protein BON22_3202 [Cyberlindnera fabianii]|uniref:Uncharacterized protein n=1 Tax=Cyberlindnera fabianii TaxID=36022 RepID=A0A1V2L5N2_CYBFA|nr:hypothetical protein BON22_3202 [Cyberlindnera fabianii]
MSDNTTIQSTSQEPMTVQEPKKMAIGSLLEEQAASHQADPKKEPSPDTIPTPESSTKDSQLDEERSMAPESPQKEDTEQSESVTKRHSSETPLDDSTPKPKRSRKLQGVEFAKYFRANKHNSKDWIPDFSQAEDDEVLAYIKFPKLEEAVSQVLGYTTTSLKPPLPDLYDDEDEAETSHNEEADPEDELLKLAGYDGSASAPPSTQQAVVVENLKRKIAILEERLESKDKEIARLEEGHGHKDTEIAFLKTMLKEDLSYLRHKLSEQK